MKNLYKKIGVVVLSGMLLAGGALVGNVSVSHANSVSLKEEINKIFKGSDYRYHKLEFLGFDYQQDPYGPQVLDFGDIDELELEIEHGMLDFGIYNVKGIFFRLSDI